jgi:hypothetical protein
MFFSRTMRRLNVDVTGRESVEATDYQAETGDGNVEVWDDRDIDGCPPNADGAGEGHVEEVGDNLTEEVPAVHVDELGDQGIWPSRRGPDGVGVHIEPFRESQPPPNHRITGNNTKRALHNVRSDRASFVSGCIPRYAIRNRPPFVLVGFSMPR